MSKARPEEHATNVRSMFTRIAARYDLLNRLMTFGQDRRWRRAAIQALRLRQEERLLDVGAGTGDLAFEALRQQENLSVVACDFTAAMLAIGQLRDEEQRIQWIIADAHALPFATGSFDAAVSGFLLRNVSDLDHTLAEQARVLNGHGRIASLDTTPPSSNLLRPFMNIYFRWIIPALGRWLAGDVGAYRYLPETTRTFMPAQTLSKRFMANGFTRVQYKRKMFGTIAIHWGAKGSKDDEPNLTGHIASDPIEAA